MADYINTFMDVLPWITIYSVTYSLLIIAIIEDSKRCKDSYIELEEV